VVKFTPREIKKNVNVSSASPLREFFVLLGGIFGVVVLVYIVLGIALDVLVERMPARIEDAVGGFFIKTYRLEEPVTAAEIKTQELLDELGRYLPEKNLAFTVHIKESPDANALALPGGHIVIFSTLLDEVESENELAMILAHELGHFINRDHLRGLGRGLVLVVISTVFFGADSTVANVAQRTLITADLKFSRKQELAADNFALELLQRKYGHVAGACDFFERIKAKRDLPAFAKFLSTHPNPSDRIILLKEEIGRRGYLVKEKIPLEDIKLFLD